MFDRYSVLDMFGPIYGDNWYGPEMSDGASFRWTGPDATSRLRLPTLGVRELRIRVVLAFAPQEDQLDSIRLRVQIGTDLERELAVYWAVRSSYATLWADVSLPTAQSSFTLQIISAPRIVDDTANESKEGRTLGLAVNKVELLALSPAVIGERARELADEVLERDQQISRILSSTSWRVSQPIRWLKGLTK